MFRKTLPHGSAALPLPVLSPSDPAGLALGAGGEPARDPYRSEHGNGGGRARVPRCFGRPPCGVDEAKSLAAARVPGATGHARLDPLRWDARRFFGRHQSLSRAERDPRHGGGSAVPSAERSVRRCAWNHDRKPAAASLPPSSGCAHLSPAGRGWRARPRRAIAAARLSASARRRAPRRRPRSRGARARGSRRRARP